MKKKAEATNSEYDRLSSDFQKLQVRLSLALYPSCFFSLSGRKAKGLILFVGIG